MLKPIEAVLMLLFAAIQLTGQEKMINNIPYYTENMPKSGNEEYLAERCKLNIYRPSEADHLPILIWFHGGGLSEGEKFIPETLKKHDVIVSAPNYRLSGVRAKAPDYLFDAAAAVKYMYDHAVQYGGDPQSIYISGGSAGGWLALMLALDPQYLGRFGLTPDQFRFMPISTATTDGIGVVLERAGTAAALVPQMRPTVSKYAPLHHVRGGAPEIDLYVGDPELDWPGRAEENMLFVRLMKRMGQNKNITLTVLTGFDHGDVYAPAMLLMLKKIHAQTLVKRAGKLPEPIEIDCDLEDRYPLTGRFGEAATLESTFRVFRENGKLVFEIANTEKNDAVVASAQKDDEKYIYQGDCVELFIAPDPQKPGEAFQVIVDPNGKMCIFGHGGATRPEAGAVRVTSARDSEHWTTRIELDESILKLKSELLFNLYRHCPLARDGRSVYVNFSPTGIERNYYPEKFATLNLNPGGTISTKTQR